MFISKLVAGNIETLLKLPETGMGYQLVNAHTISYFPKQYLVLNGKYAIETGDKNFNQIFDNLYGKNLEGDFRNAKEIILTIKSVVGGDKSIGSFVKESGLGKDVTAKEAVKGNANGDELFVRLSAFDDDIRIDKQKKCLRPGSYTTTAADALRCKTENDDPGQRYSLPNELEIKWSFNIQPIVKDQLQRGWVQPVDRVLTFISQTKW
jgi:hypothetical protein